MTNILFRIFRPKEFCCDTRGVVAIIYGLLFIPIIAFCGLAIDMARGFRASQIVVSATDAAVLAGAKGLRVQNMTDAEVVDAVTRMFNSNIPRPGVNTPTINALNVTINRATGSVALNVDAELPTVIGGVVGVHMLNVSQRGVAIFENKDIEVAVQLDVTGSMSGQKIEDLRLATKDLVEILIPDDKTLLNGRKVRIGFAPYAAGVNAGGYAQLMNGGVEAPNECVYERANLSYQDSDTYPSGAAVLKTKLDLPWANDCSSATILPLTDDKWLLKSTIDTYTTGGTTAGHLGTAFAWYLLSPEWASIWPAGSEPAPYDADKVIKVAILMTDGEYNTVGGSRSGANASRSTDYARDTCRAMKDDRLIIYTVGFKLDDATAITTLRQCASSGDKFYTADDGNALRLAFRNIAQDLARLRLAE